MSIDVLADNKQPASLVSENKSQLGSEKVERKQQWIGALERESLNFTEQSFVKGQHDFTERHNGKSNTLFPQAGEQPTIVNKTVVTPSAAPVNSAIGVEPLLVTEFLIDNYRANSQQPIRQNMGQLFTNQNRENHLGKVQLKTAELHHLPIEPSQLKKFEPYNVRLVRVKEGYALWLRDYSESYLSELENFAATVKELLSEQGSRLDHIILNGKKIIL